MAAVPPAVARSAKACATCTMVERVQRAAHAAPHQPGQPTAARVRGRRTPGRLAASNASAAPVNTVRSAEAVGRPAGRVLQQEAAHADRPATLAAVRRSMPASDAEAAPTAPSPASNTPPQKASSASQGTRRRACRCPCGRGRRTGLVAGAVRASSSRAATMATPSHSAVAASSRSSPGRNGPSASAPPSAVWYRPITRPRMAAGASSASSASLVFHSAAAPMPATIEARAHTATSSDSA